MKSKFVYLLKKFAWLFPIFVVTIGIFYYINLFERIYERDLNRQINEKSQLMTLVENLSELKDVEKTVITMDGFENTYTYLLEDESGVINEIYHAKNCPFRLKEHPFECKELSDLINSKRRGSFKTENEKEGNIIWEYRHFKAGNEKLLVIAGVTNYPQDPIDKELQISIGILLLITAILNWALVGYAKNMRSNIIARIKNERRTQNKNG